MSSLEIISIKFIGISIILINVLLNFLYKIVLSYFFIYHESNLFLS